ALPAELRSWAWCTGDELEARLSAHVLRRTRAARRARAEGTTLYLENGSPIRRLLQPSRLRGAAVPQHAARRVDEAGREDPDVAQVRVVDRPPAELLDVAALVLAEVGPTQLGRGETAPEVPLVDRTRDARGIGDALATSPDARPRIVDDLPRLLEDLPHHRSVEALPGLDPASDEDPVVGDRVRRVERHFVAHPHQQDPAVRSGDQGAHPPPEDGHAAAAARAQQRLLPEVRRQRRVVTWSASRPTPRRVAEAKLRCHSRPT